jgi:hypothetical protein
MRRDHKLFALVPLIETNVRNAFYPSDRAQQVIKDNRVQPSLVKKDKLHQVVDAFVANVDRIDSLAVALPLFVHMGLQTGEHGTLSWGTGNVTFTLGGGETAESIVGRMWESVSEYLEKRPKIKTGVELAISHISHWCILEEEAIDAWLASLITGAWTAFEMLASDLWEESLNCHPQCLARLKGLKGQNSPKQEKAVSLIRLSKPSCVIASSFVTILRTGWTL